MKTEKNQNALYYFDKEGQLIMLPMLKRRGTVKHTAKAKEVAKSIKIPVTDLTKCK